MADRALRIAIDGRELSGKPTGVGRYLFELMREWSHGAAGHRFAVVVAREPDETLRALGPSFSWCVEPDESAGTRWEQTALPRRLRREQPDVFFAVGNTAPLRMACPFVVTIHDASYFAHPEWFDWRDGLRRRWLTRSAARRARTIITVSEFSKAELSRHLRLPPERFVIASPGAPPPTPVRASPRARTVLYVGSLFNRRHIPELLTAFALTMARVPDARLVLVGDDRTTPRLDPRAIAQELGIAAFVDWREYVDEPELARLYEGARVFAFLSEYEGFGITPLEALAHGTPCVVRDTAVAREVYGDGAVRVSASPEAIADALTLLLTSDTDHARVLAAGRARLAAYDWGRSAATVLRALEEAAR